MYTFDTQVISKSKNEEDQKKFDEIISVRTSPSFYLFLFWFSFNYNITIHYLTDEISADNSIISLGEIIIFPDKVPVTSTVGKPPFEESEIKVTFYTHTLYYKDNLFSVFARKNLLLNYTINEEMPEKFWERRIVPKNHPKFHSIKFICYCKLWNDYTLGFYP